MASTVSKKLKTGTAFCLDSDDEDDDSEEEKSEEEMDKKRKSPNKSKENQSDNSLSPEKEIADEPIQLTQDQLDRIEANRRKALEIRQAKEKEKSSTNNLVTKIVLSSTEQKKLIDTGAGFYLDEEDLIEEEIKEKQIVQEPPIPIPSDLTICERCNQPFPHSFLTKNFDLNVCDCCKTKHSDDYDLVTRTDAKTQYLLKDCDFDFREPVLKFICKKNPHNTRWGDMKLYLRCQVEKRAMEVHESDEKLEEKKEMKLVNLHKTRQKNYEKKLTQLRKEARQVSKKQTEFHQHDFGDESYNKKKDIYYKVCKTCSHKLEYEKL